MERKKLGLVIGLTVALAGFGLGNYYSPKESKPKIVEEYYTTYKDLSKAKERFSKLTEDFNYIPQYKRYDYSAGAAHSEVENAFQNLQIKEGKVRDLEKNLYNNQEAKQWLSENNRSAIGYLTGLIGLLYTSIYLTKKYTQETEIISKKIK